jgi:hypothetical protein
VDNGTGSSSGNGGGNSSNSVASGTQTSSSASTSAESSGSIGGGGGATSQGGAGGTGGGGVTTVTVDPTWQRTDQYFLAIVPCGVYYAANTAQLYNEDDTPAMGGFTWTSSAWDGGDSAAQTGSPITGFVAADYWFKTFDRVNDGMTGTHYWFRATVDVGQKANVVDLKLFDKYHPDDVTVNDGFSVFVNGAEVFYTKDPGYLAQYFYDPSLSTQWAMPALSIPLQDFHDGANEIAVLYEERWNDGGLGHLQVQLSRSGP